MWWFVALFVAGLVLSYATMPKQQSQKPAGLSEIEAPIAEEGVEIPVLFGTRDLNGPNVVWYGDLKTVAIKSKGGKK
ncbi:MAG: hypothetical protein CMQ11_07050 [Gammaproteobacteria bacterium]|nr:hypothetical protein [Gammaproteobacteria bacterium]